jgi:hypothetical protein
MRPPALTALLVALVLTAGPITAAEAATTRSICTRTAVLYDSPPTRGGFVIGRLTRSQRVRLQGYDPNRRWALVIVRGGTAGWVSAKSLCRA